MKRHSGWRTAILAVASTLVVALVGVGAIGAYAAFDLAGSANQTVDLGNEDVLKDIPDVGAFPGGINLLVIGSDSREGQGEAFGEGTEDGVLNDVTMLLHISEDHSHAEVVSFPRDMFTSVPACDDPEEEGSTLSPLSRVKINTVLSYGGMGCVVDTVEQITGVEIPFAGIVQFNGVIGLSDAVGGVEVCVAEQIDDSYTGIHLTPGNHTLQGVDALQFLRTRHGVGDGSDLGRISNQQVFLSSLARKLQSDGVLSNPATLYGIAQAALSNMTLSSTLESPLTMVQIAMALNDIDLSKLAFIQYPTGYVEGGVIAKSDEAEAVNLALQNDTPVTFDAETQANSSIATEADPNAVTTTPAAPVPDVDTDGDGVADQVANTDTDGDGVNDAYVAPVEAPAPTEGASEQLDGVIGQTGDEARCSVSNDG
ncbi:LCP family protein [Agromyces seonyuensis]|uniref:LytR family transcriptional regulator n=1 Tax=Agromyces seonyuensis TaxID=2662446 RepID=A0A6I4P038_9MICO|nr:LCP family protein [Agromyces seonyuensis]MWB98105.1 LytR family transcriptional regulator [Agromyces seonyuensis]